MSYRLAIFDFDGTLADSSAWMLEAFNACADKFGFRKLNRAEIEGMRGLDNRAIIRELGVPMWKLPQIANHVRALAAEAEPAPLFDGIGEMLPALKAAGVKLGVVSSNSEATIRRALGDKLAAAIDHYACDASLFGKADKFKKLLKDAGVSPEEAIAGDETRDIEAARKARISCAAVTWGYAIERVLKEHAPDHVFTNVAELRAALTA